MQTIYLNWPNNLPKAVAQTLLQDRPRPYDLSDTLVITPTRQSGRRLRKALADLGPLRPPTIEIPGYFTQPPAHYANIATATESLSAWLAVFEKNPLKHYPSLFPRPPQHPGPEWFLPLIKQIQQLRTRLSEVGLRISSVPQTPDIDLEEPERWTDLARLEQAYFDHLAQHQKYDRLAHIIKPDHSPELPPHIQRIVLAAVPDPNPVVIRVLDQLRHKVPLFLYLIPSREHQHRFDAWGRPLSEEWSHFGAFCPPNPSGDSNPFPEPEWVLCEKPEDQARRVIHIMAQEATQFGFGDVAVGVPDPEVSHPLRFLLEEHQLEAFDPSGNALTDHPFGRLVMWLLQGAQDRRYRSWSRLLRHTLFLQQVGDNASVLLKTLDEFHQMHLPEELGDAIEQAAPYPLLAESLKRLEKALDEVLEDPVRGLRNVLTDWLGDLALDKRTREGARDVAVLRALSKALDEVAKSSIPAPPKRTSLLVQDALSRELWREPEPPVRLDMDGWLELVWQEAPLLVVTGLNEGCVPDTPPPDPFLTDSLAEQLGLRSDRSRFTRDVFYLACLLMARRKRGKVVLLAGKFSQRGDALIPSRLFFVTRATLRLERARGLYGEALRYSLPQEATSPIPLRVPSFSVPSTFRMSASKARDFLSCPFRFYLKHFMGGTSLKDDATELDGLGFGSALHAALEALPAKENQQRSEEVVFQALDRWLQKRFGTHLPLQVEVQRYSLRRRLRAAVEVHLAQLEEGWELVERELRLSRELDGMLFSGSLDRVERHRDTGAYRVLDYKSFDSSEMKIKKIVYQVSRPFHREYMAAGAKLNKSWKDVQLPVYHYLATPRFGEVEVGYFLLPKVISKTGVLPWEPDMTQAMTCLGGMVADIREGRFLPAFDLKAEYDDLVRLFVHKWEGASDAV